SYSTFGSAPCTEYLAVRISAQAVHHTQHFLHKFTLVISGPGGCFCSLECGVAGPDTLLKGSKRVRGCFTCMLPRLTNCAAVHQFQNMAGQCCRGGILHSNCSGKLQIEY